MLVTWGLKLGRPKGCFRILRLLIRVSKAIRFHPRTTAPFLTPFWKRLLDRGPAGGSEPGPLGAQQYEGPDENQKPSKASI